MHVPTPLVQYLNNQLDEPAIEVQSIEFPSNDQVVVNCSATKLGQTVLAKVSCRLAFEGGVLNLSDVTIGPQDSNPNFFKRKAFEVVSPFIMKFVSTRLNAPGIRIDSF